MARLAELRHAEVLSRSAQKHLSRPTAEPLKCEPSMEESKYLSKLGRALGRS